MTGKCLYRAVFPFNFEYALSPIFAESNGNRVFSEKIGSCGSKCVGELRDNYFRGQETFKFSETTLAVTCLA